MPNILIRDVPEDLHRRLQACAAQEGQSLQQYLSSELERIAALPTMAEMVARIERSGDGSRLGFAEAVTSLDAERR